MSQNADAWHPTNLELRTEYDFHSLIHLSLGAWCHNLRPEPKVVEIDGSSKNADFALFDSRLFIEAKHITGTSKRSAVEKTLDSLGAFYSMNPGMHSLLFVILYEPDVKMDTSYLEKQFSNALSDRPIMVKYIKNYTSI